MSTPSLLTRAALFLPCLLALFPLNGSAAVLPYRNDFDSGGDAFPSATSGHWAVSGGYYVDTITMPDNHLVRSSSAFQIADPLSLPSSFTITTQFSVPAVDVITSSTYRTISIALFGDGPTFENSSTTLYYARFAFAAGASSALPKGHLGVNKAGDATGFSKTNSSAIASGASGFNAIALNTTYTLRLDVSRNGGQMTLTLGLYDAAGTTQIGSSATATDLAPLTGNYFGYFNTAGTGISTGASQTINFDNFVMSVPEPGSLALSAVAVGGLLLAGKFRPRCGR